MKKKLEELKVLLFTFLMVALPIVISMFCVIVITALSPHRWLTIALQMPVWLLLLWWMYYKDIYQP